MKNFPAQYSLQNQDVLYFCHIPKTAGMTFRTIIEDQFACEDVCPATLNAQLKKLSLEELRRYRLFRGHLGFSNLPSLLPDKRVINITVLREPVARVISHYDYIRRMPGDPHYAAVKDMTLEEFAQRLTAGKLGKNIQTYHVAKTARFDLDKLSVEETLALATDSLDQFGFVGLVERFQDSLFLLSYIFGWKPILNSRKENAAKQKKPLAEIPESTLAVIRANSQLDAELFQRAKATFEQRFDAMVADLLAKYGSALPDHKLPDHELPDRDGSQLTPAQLTTLLEHHADQRYRELHQPAGEIVSFNFNQPLRGTGWQRREYPLDNPISYRWIGPEPVATLDLPVKTDTDLCIEFQLICTGATTAEVVNSLKLDVNGHPVPTFLLQGDRDQRLLQAQVPQPLLQNQRPFTNLRFKVAKTLALNSINPENPDQRLVGLALNFVQIFPAKLNPVYSVVAPAFDSPPWQEAVAFLQQHCPATDLIASPLVFKIHLPNPVEDYQTFTRKGGFPWVVVHKGMPDWVDRMMPSLIRQGLAPVLANEVFVIFSNRRLPRLSYTHPDVKPLYVDYLRRSLGRVIKPIRQRFQPEPAALPQPAAGNPAPAQSTGNGRRESAPPASPAEADKVEAKR
ncbi:MAG: sulfotransferase family 2 domain-containing protein [Elainella sp.]